MSKETLINDLEKDFKGKLFVLTNEEKKHLVDKDTFRGRIFGFLTKSYYRRFKLFEEGSLTYAYVFKTWNNSFGSDKPYPIWFLFSPEKYFLKNPYELEKITAKLGLFVKQYQQKEGKYKKLFTNLTESLSEPNYFELPKEFAGDHLVYLHMTYIRPHQNPHFSLGYNVVCFSKLVSKEVLLLPELFWTKEYKNDYLKIKVEEKLLK